MLRHALLSLLLMLLSSCTGLPENVTPVTGFTIDRYLGTWYEIARLDHSFERGLNRVSATYSQRDDGGVTVLNRGYDESRSAWKEAEGKAYFMQDPATAYLKVSFFGPFYGAYVIIELDHENYSYALVSGPDRTYLWILSRTPEMDENLYQTLISKAATLDYDVKSLIRVQH
jgi:apolipoprotein D and lipocalin family protein